MRLDISRTLAIYLVYGVVSVYGMFTIQELEIFRDYPDFELFIGDVVEWEPGDIISSYTYHAKFAMAKAGVLLFKNWHVVPLMLSAGCIIVSAMLARQWTGMNIAAPIAAFLVAFNNLFKFFDTSGVYDNSWTLFFLLALYFVNRKWQLVPLFFVLGILSKGIIFLFMPSIVLFALCSPISKNGKIWIILSCGALSALAIGMSGYGSNYIGLEFDGNGFIDGLYEWYVFILSDLYAIALIPFTMLVLGIAAMRKVRFALPILISMLNVALIGAPLEAFTNDIWNEPYRYVPLICLFAAAFPLAVLNFKGKNKTLLASKPATS